MILLFRSFFQSLVINRLQYAYLLIFKVSDYIALLKKSLDFSLKAAWCLQRPVVNRGLLNVLLNA